MQPERIQFPADYPIKVVARTEASLRERIHAVFERHFGPQPAETVGERHSAQGHFISLTYTPRVSGEEQLRALHAELSVLDGVLMVL
jgi:putative lipoic acid-binding regulatory protein